MRKTVTIKVFGPKCRFIDQRNFTMDIVIGGTPSVQKEPQKGNIPMLTGKTVIRRDRRKNKQDRRISAREGIFISFSGMNDRRAQRDRRIGSS